MKHRLAMARRSLAVWSRRCSGFMLRPDTASHLFKLCVLPVLEYGIPIWGLQGWASKPWKDIEAFVTQTARRILGAPRQAPVDALFGDLGCMAAGIWVRSLILASNYWTRVAGLPPTSLTRKALITQRQLLESGHSCWLLQYRRQMEATPQAASFWQDWWARGEDPGFRTVTSRVEGGKVVHVPWAEDLRGRPSRRQLMSSGGAEFRLGRQGRAQVVTSSTRMHGLKRASGRRLT